MALDRLYYEMKLMGKRIVLAPTLIMLGAALLALLMRHVWRTDPARFLLAISEIILPLVAGVIVGTVIAIDPALELQLTLPKKYPVTGVLRVVLIFMCMACSALLFINGTNVCKLLHLPGFTASWSPISRFLLIQGIWFPPMFWCVIVGFCFALIMQSRTAGAALLGGIWVAEIFFKDYFWLVTWLRPFVLFPVTLLLYPLTNLTYSLYITGVTQRLELLGTALALLPFGWFLLCNTERMLKGATEE